MKTIASALAIATLLSLTACAKQGDTGANLSGDEAAINAGTIGNDGAFASDNVILPEDNVTDADIADPINAAGNAN